MEDGRGLVVVMDDVPEFMEDVAGKLVDSVLEDVVFEMARGLCARYALRWVLPMSGSSATEGQLDNYFF